jgi:hypothetical protein
MFETLGSHETDPGTGLPVWRMVPAEVIVEFLRRYRTVQTRRTFDADTAADYIEAQVNEGELEQWTVAVRTQMRAAEGLPPFPLRAPTLREVNAISRTRLKSDLTSIGVLTQPAVRDTPLRGDEEIGLSPAAADAARAALAAGDHESLREALIAQRERGDGLLIVYPISRKSRPRPGSDDRLDLFDDADAPDKAVDVAGVAIVFPRSDSTATVEYVAGSAPEDDPYE